MRSAVRLRSVAPGQRVRPDDAFERAVIGMAVIGIDRKMKRANPALCAMLGYTVDQMVGSSFSDYLFDDEAAESVEDTLQLLTGAGTTTQRIRQLRRADGTIVWSHVTLAVLRDENDKPYIYLQMVDVERERWAREEARSSGERMHALLAGAPVTYVALDLKGRVLLVEGGTDDAGRSRMSSATGDRTFYEVYADFPDMIRAYEAALSGVDYAGTIEVHGRTYDVRTRPMRDPDGRVTYIHSVSTDVTDRARMEATLRARSSQQSAVAELGHLALGGIDLQTLYQRATDTVADQLRVEVSVFYERHGDVLRSVAGHGPRQDLLGALPFPTSAAVPSGRAAVTGRPAILPARDDEPPYDVDVLKALEIRSGVAVPVGDRDDPLGVLTAYSHGDRPMDEDEISFLEGIAHVLGATTQRSRTDAEIRHRAVHDQTTGLPNRTLLLDRLAVALTRTAGAVSVLYLDVDGFKTVNDALGHTAGDAVLRAVADRLAGAVGSSDTLARLDGDEFAVVTDGGSPADAVRLSQELIDAVAAPFDIAGRSVAITACVGVAVSTSRSDLPESLLRDAGLAVYSAKRAGRGRYELFDRVMRLRVARQVEMENDLRRALPGGQLRLAYQPITDLDGGMIGVEALMRWNHPRRGPVPPSEFVPLAEEIGLIEPLGSWALQEACDVAGAYTGGTAGERPLRMSVNVSPRQLSDPVRLDEICTAAARRRGEGFRLCLEITESALIANEDAVRPALERLRSQGVIIAMDDFGTGHSSLGRLRSLPVDILKIDATFVRGLGRDPRDDAIVGAIVDLGHAVGLEVVGEGVETAVQVEVLRAAGCDFVQGHFLAPPEVDLDCRPAAARTTA